MSSEMLHEKTHVPEVLWTDATLEPRILVFRLSHVDVKVDLTLLLEQDVVDRANNLKEMYK